MAEVRGGIESFLYPEIEPTAGGMLALDGLHEMYWEVSGAPAGLVSLATVYGVEELLPTFAPGR